MKPYKAKSLAAAERRVRRLEKRLRMHEKLVPLYESLLEQSDRERLMLAKLAAETPQFFNPFDAWKATALRDMILSGEHPSMRKAE